MGWRGLAWAWRAVLVAGLVACNPHGLQPVDDTSSDDTADTDTGGGVDDLIGILVAPDRAAVPLGGELQLVATGLKGDRTSVDVTALATWGSDHPNIASVSDALDSEGLLTAHAVGDAKVFAEVDGIRSPDVKVTVIDSALMGLSVKPTELTVSKGEVAHLTAEAAFTDGTRSDASAQVIWVTGNGDVATMETGGKLTAVETGSTTVHAEWQGKSSPDVPVTVVVGADPNLEIGSVEAESGGGDVTLNVKVVNSGDAGASEFWVDVFVDPMSPPGPDDLGDYYVPVAYADAGETLDLSFTFDARQGEHEVWVVADLAGQVAESDENDNTWHQALSFGDEPAGPNLEITWFDYYADSTQIFFVIDVHNSGSAAVGQFYVDLWIDEDTDPTPSGVGDEFKSVESLEAGATEYVDFVVPLTSLPSGANGCASCKSWAMADTNLDVPETDETDNVAGPMDVSLP